MEKIRQMIRLIVIGIQYLFYAKLKGMDIARSARISVGTHLDKVNPRGIHM